MSKKKEVKAYEPKTWVLAKCAPFMKVAKDFGSFSNFKGMTVGYTVNKVDYEFKNSEAAYQALRFLPHMPELAVQMQDMWAGDAKEFSRANIEHTRNDWMDGMRVECMRFIVRRKYEYNFSELQKEFNKVGRGTPIVELSYKDQFWGAKQNSPRQGLATGCNVLGIIWTELMDELIEGFEAKTPYKKAKLPSGFLKYKHTASVVKESTVKEVNAMKEITCMVTGHRPESKVDGVKVKKLPWGYKVQTQMNKAEQAAFDKCMRALDKAISMAYDDGYRIFVTGMALGIDQLFAWRVNLFKKTHDDVSLVAYLPCYGQEKKWTDPRNKAVWLHILQHWADEWFFVTEDDYKNAGCLDKRNKAMVADSSMCIAVWDGSSGGTGNAVNDLTKSHKLLQYNPKTEKLSHVR